MRGRWWVVATVMAAVALVGVGLVAAYKQRIAPAYPTVAGEPYQIALDADGCPMIPERPQFVDSPGDLVPPDPVEAVLCSLPTKEFFQPDGDLPGGDLPGWQRPTVPLKRVLTSQAAAEFAAILNRLPDRNTVWRDWQRRHSGLWPDAPPVREEVCLGMAYPYDYTYLLSYADRPSVALISACGSGGLTTGARTRLDIARPHLLDEFTRLLDT